MCVSRNRDQPWSYRYYEITLSCPARVRAQLAFRVGDDLGVGRPSIYTTAFLAGNPVNFPHLAGVGPLYEKPVYHSRSRWQPSLASVDRRLATRRELLRDNFRMRRSDQNRLERFYTEGSSHKLGTPV